MKIIAPLRSVDQINTFIEMGADEFYGGVVFEPWMDLYGKSIEYNRRGNFSKKANFFDTYEFSSAISFLLEQEKAFSLTVNALRISQAQLPIIEHIFSLFKNLGGERIIATDISVIELAVGMGLYVTVSSCADIKNSATIDFYKRFGIDKVIFPRDITFSEMEEIVRSNPEIDFEAFLINSACKFVDGCCLGLHDTQVGSLCAFIDNCESDYHFSGNIVELTDNYKFQCKQNNFFYKGLLKDACGYCAIYDLLNIGVNSCKVVGRLLNKELLAEQIFKIKKFIDIAKCCYSREEYLEKIKPDLNFSSCRNGYNCYFPEIYNDVKLVCSI